MIAPGSSTACVAPGALTPSIASSSCRQENKLSNDGLFVFLRRTGAELARLGASPFSLGASPCKACSPPFMPISSTSVHFFECSLSCRLDLLDWISFLYPSVDWSALAIALNRLRVTSRSAGHQDDAWAQRSGECYFFFAFWSLCPSAVWFFVAEGLFVFFLVDWSSFPTPPNRKMWLLVPIGISRGVLCRLRFNLCIFFCFFERTASGSVCNDVGHTPKCPKIGVLLNNRATKFAAFLLPKFGVR